MMTLYFCLFDACKRNGYASTPAGQFFSSGGCALIGFWVVWPFENLKNQAQAGKNWAEHARATGLLGLYRGIVPGSDAARKANVGRPTPSTRRRRRGGARRYPRSPVDFHAGSMSVFLRNGAAMIVMQRANRLITDLGLRGQ